MNHTKGFTKGSDNEKAYNTYLGIKQPEYIAKAQPNGTFLRLTNGKATSTAKTKNQLAKAYKIE